jgi:glycosyltransferase involved in cell wall biosynthesis
VQPSPQRRQNIFASLPLSGDRGPPDVVHTTERILGLYRIQRGRGVRSFVAHLSVLSRRWLRLDGSRKRNAPRIVSTKSATATRPTRNCERGHFDDATPAVLRFRGESMRNGIRFGAFTFFLLAVASITGDPDCKRALVAYGDANAVDTWSNIPYFFLQAGRRIGLFDAGVTLRPRRFRRRRILWNALRPLTLNRPCGYMYSRAHLHALWADRRAPSGIGEYVSHIQSLPPRESVREPVSYYIDATMRQYFDDYGRSLGRRIRAEAVAREKEAYEAARFVVCMSRWCAEDVKASYGISPAKVRVIRPGANIHDESVPAAAVWDGSLAPLRLGFIGIDWERKGGPVLLDAAARLQRMGHSVEVVVIGPDASELPQHPALRPIGFIHKARELPRFVEVVRSFHFGCLLSHAEALGISTLECLRLGVPVIATAVGGIVDTVPRGAGLLMPGRPRVPYVARDQRLRRRGSRAATRRADLRTKPRGALAATTGNSRTGAA